jgi:hypothetical protein
MTTPATRPFSDPYLLEYSKHHVWYEVAMFFGIVDMVSRQVICARSEEEAKILNSSLIEAFAVHFRNVLDFLYNDHPRPTDVVAADFCASDSWKDARPPLSQFLQGHRDRMNKQIGHLTTERYTGDAPEKRWPFQDLANAVRPLLTLFVAQARPSALSPRVAEVIPP